MPGSVERGVPARHTAVLVVDAVIHQGRSLDEAAPGFETRLANGDRALARELAYGSLRWYRRFAEIVDLLLTRPLKPRDRVLKAVLVVGLYQLEGTRIPGHAAVSATVGVARALQRPWAARLLNGCLRRFQRERGMLLARVDHQSAAAAALPDWLYGAISADWPLEHKAVFEACLARPPFTLRVNRLVVRRDAYCRELATVGLTARPLAGAPDALVLDRAVAVDALPGFAEGRVSVQDGAAQLIPGLVDAGRGMRVLDACAAPGGKTAHLLERVPALSLLALDRDPTRLARVRENLSRTGLEAEVRVGDAAEPAEWWDGQYFDRILLDAPCSGTGVIRRRPDVKWLRRATDIPQLAKTQTALLHALWSLLAPGGRLVYATCSLLRAENESVAAGFAAAMTSAHPATPELSVGRSTGVGHQILPGEENMDGFYYACFDKR